MCSSALESYADRFTNDVAIQGGRLNQKNRIHQVRALPRQCVSVKFFCKLLFAGKPSRGNVPVDLT